MKHIGTRAIETQRLLLRRFQPEDAEPMYGNWASDPEVTKFLTWPTHPNTDVTKSVVLSWVGSYEKADYYQWAIVPKELGEPIGSISVVHLDEEQGDFEIGYCIGRRWWRQGYTSEALRGVMDELFRHTDAKSVSARHDTNNPNSGAVMRKCGMMYVCTKYNGDENNQGICDVAYYTIKREEWENTK